jgi:hypothetical protein
MTLRDDLLRTISDGWQLVEDLGCTQYTVTIRSRSWSGGHVQLGTETITNLTLSPNPWVEEAGDGVLRVSGITPSDGSIGYTFAQLRPTEDGDEDFYFIVTGPNGTHNYRLDSIDTSDAWEYRLTLRALTRAMPF